MFEIDPLIFEGFSPHFPDRSVYRPEQREPIYSEAPFLDGLSGIHPPSLEVKEIAQKLARSGTASFAQLAYLPENRLGEIFGEQQDQLIIAKSWVEQASAIEHLREEKVYGVI